MILFDSDFLETAATYSLSTVSFSRTNKWGRPHLVFSIRYRPLEALFVEEVQHGVVSAKVVIMMTLGINVSIFYVSINPVFQMPHLDEVEYNLIHQCLFLWPKVWFQQLRSCTCLKWLNGDRLDFVRAFLYINISGKSLLLFLQPEQSVVGIRFYVQKRQGGSTELLIM